MNEYYDYKKFAVLFVDDNRALLESVVDTFGDSFRIITATSGIEGYELLEKHRDEIGVLVTDERMPPEGGGTEVSGEGVKLLERARHLRPRIIRILSTAYADMDAAIAAVNSGSIYKYLLKPWAPENFETNLRRALEFFMVQQERDQLLKEKLSVIHNMMIADRIVSLGLLAQGLSQHIRNPLQAVRTFMDLAPIKIEEEKRHAGELRDPEFWQEYYKNAQSQLEKITNLLNDLWSAPERPNAGFADMVQVRPLVEGEVERLKPGLAAKNITVSNNIPADLPEIGADAAKVRRLFELLLRDELASLPAGAHIALSGRYQGEKGSGQGEVEILLQDNGPGLPTEALRLLFDPFTLRMDLPTEYGINLMGCFFIVHHHGGRIDACSEVGKGTAFSIHLPVNPSKAPTEDRQEFLQKVLLNETVWEKLISSS